MNNEMNTTIAQQSCEVIKSYCKLSNLPTINFHECFIETINQHCGYNEINTFTYAIIALISVFLLYRYLIKKKLVDVTFAYMVLAIMIYAPLARVITDALEHTSVATVINAFDQITNGFYRYSFVTSSPGIYLFSFLVFSILMIIRLKTSEKFSLTIAYALVILHAIIVLLSIKFINHVPLIIILVVFPCAITLFSIKYFLKNEFEKVTENWKIPILIVLLPIIGHALDGSSTYYAIEHMDEFGVYYFEQHVVPEIIGKNLGYFSFYIIKVLLSVIALLFLLKYSESKEEFIFFILVFSIPGFSPGLRSFLRMLLMV
ncbi:MAG: DUF63 family protein [Candidatus Micrarchaeota archaeon]|nr:DUF63 family protein [Candidatus Micrarchaeota archaeon]